MKRATIPVSIAMLVTAVITPTSVSANAENNLETEALQITTQGSAIAYPRFVRMEKTERGLRIKGQLNKRTHSRRRYLGHIDLEFVDQECKIPRTKTISISPAQWRKNRYSRRFSTMIDDLPTETKVVQVKSHPGNTQHN